VQRVSWLLTPLSEQVMPSDAALLLRNMEKELEHARSWLLQASRVLAIKREKYATILEVGAPWRANVLLRICRALVVSDVHFLVVFHTIFCATELWNGPNNACATTHAQCWQSEGAGAARQECVPQQRGQPQRCV